MLQSLDIVKRVKPAVDDHVAAYDHNDDDDDDENTSVSAADTGNIVRGLRDEGEESRGR